MKRLYFLYHELRQVPSPYSYVVSCGRFEQHCELFARLRAAESDTLRPEITFDDGHRSNYEFALPVLERHGLTAHFFVTVGWMGQRAGYMGWDELRALHASGQTIGAHGWTHTLLTHCALSDLDRELSGARRKLEDELGAAVTSMSLPGGRSNRLVLDACWKAGYTEVFTSLPMAQPEAVSGETSIGRLNVRGTMSAAWLEQVLRPESGLLVKMERRERVKTAAKTILGDALYARLWSVGNREEPDSGTHGAPSE
ncbi:MAG TPA: polysaccharide deacetylase family protein [Acidobacteriaceae bacterium]|jgi:peptidoglycan/xylan/chitin deacetylase (PgdA/CDA1 family)|nr:polysaccharide deacetylase family protein [Acidobacteriaceae bacterium]